MQELGLETLITVQVCIAYSKTLESHVFLKLTVAQYAGALH